MTPTRIARLSVAALLMAGAVPALAQTSPARSAESGTAGIAATSPSRAPIRAVTLSAAGLAEIVREAGLAGARRTIGLDVDLKDIDDVLKSLVVLGRNLDGASLRLAGPSPLEDAFASLPFTPDDLGDLEKLAAAMPGARVVITSGAEEIEGSILGVRPPESCPEAATSPCRGDLLLIDAEGAITRIPLTGRATLRFADSADLESVRRGVDAVAGSTRDGRRRILVDAETAEGSDQPILISYVLAAPIWKSAWKASIGADGEVAVQVWAVVENAGGEDWQDIRLTLSSGSPRTLRAKLFERGWASRDLFDGETAADLTMMRSEDASSGASVASMMEMAPAPMAQVRAGTAIDENALDARFTFDDPISLKSGEMISLPFVSGAIPARRYSHYTGGSGAGHPELALDITNELAVRLPGGIMTLYEDGIGYRGDAGLADLAPGETRIVPFATDVKTRITETSRLDENRISLRLQDGILMIRKEAVTETDYRITAPSDGGRLVVLDHPDDRGSAIEILDGADGYAEIVLEDGREARRFEINLAAGAERMLKLRETVPLEERVSLRDISTELLLERYGTEISDRDRAIFEALAVARRTEAELARSLDETQGRIRTDIAEQERARVLLGSVPEGGEAHRRYLDKMLGLEDAIETGRARAEDLENRLRAAMTRIDEIIAGT